MLFRRRVHIELRRLDLRFRIRLGLVQVIEQRAEIVRLLVLQPDMATPDLLLQIQGVAATVNVDEPLKQLVVLDLRVVVGADLLRGKLTYL